MLHRSLAVLAFLLLLGACTSEPSATPKTWSVVIENLPGALLSVWGTSAKDVWTVGGSDTKHPENGPMVLHWDGKTWTALKTGVKGDLAWVTPGATSDELWMVGRNGLILKYLRSTGKFEQFPSGTTQWLWGVAVTGPSDGWAVGGAPGCASAKGGTLLHWDGKAWGPAPGIDASLLDSTSCWFKVWARNKDDVWVVGAGGKALHFDGATWKAVDTAQQKKQSLFTVSGNANLTVAVGGAGMDGSIIEDSGNGFVEKSKKVALNGVFVEASGHAVAVGGSGMAVVWQRKGGVWSEFPGVPELMNNEDFHGVWVDAGGGVWAVGGNLMADPQQAGVVVHHGASHPASYAQ